MKTELEPGRRAFLEQCTSVRFRPGIARCTMQAYLGDLLPNYDTGEVRGFANAHAPPFLAFEYGSRELDKEAISMVP